MTRGVGINKAAKTKSTQKKGEDLFYYTNISRITRPYSARSVKTIDPEIREILIFTLWPGFAFATYIM
jgi:hypothetical protein